MPIFEKCIISWAKVIMSERREKAIWFLRLQTWKAKKGRYSILSHLENIMIMGLWFFKQKILSYLWATQQDFLTITAYSYLALFWIHQRFFHFWSVIGKDQWKKWLSLRVSTIQRFLCHWMCSTFHWLLELGESLHNLH